MTDLRCTTERRWEPRDSFASSPKLLDRFWARFDKGKPQIATLKGNEELTPGKPGTSDHNNHPFGLHIERCLLCNLAAAIEDDDDDEEEEAPKRTPKAKRKSITKENPSPASTKRKRGRPSAAESTTSKRRKSNA